MSPKTFFNIEDIETVFKDAFERGYYNGSGIRAAIMTTEDAWAEYKNSNPVTLQSQQSIQPTDTKPVELFCPDCGSKMVSRKGQYGTFWGCTTYPKCKGTRDSNGRSKAERKAYKAEQENKPKDNKTWSVS